MSTQRIAFIAMWLLAIATMLGLYRWLEHGSHHPHSDENDAPLLTPRDGPSRLPRGAGAREYESEQAFSQFRLDRRHTARTPHRGPDAAAVLFRVPTSGSITAQAVLSREGELAFVGSLDHHLYAVTSEGRVAWRRDLGEAVYSTAARIDSRVFVGSDADAFWGLDARTGEVRWQVRTRGDADTGVAITPDGDLVFGTDDEVWRVSQEGNVRWRFRTEGKVWSAPAVDDDGTIVFGSGDDHVYALGADGRMRWRYKTGDDVDCAPMIGDDGTVYVGSDDSHVYAFSPDGELLWSTAVDGYVRAPLALGRDRRIYVPVFPPRPRVVALEPETGRIVWSFDVGARGTGNSASGGPIVDADGNLYFGADDTFVYSLTPDGRLRWFGQTGGNVDGEPVLRSDGVLLIGSDDHTLYGFGPSR